MGREVIAEMNRVGMAIDMSHSGERSTREAIDLSARPIAITHANPASWHKVPRNKSDAVLKALAARGGMLGLSLYPHHLRGGSECTLESFTAMVARLADLIGVDHIGIGSDLCQDQPDSVVAWMRNGRWTKSDASIGLGAAVFPPQPDWFRDNRDFGKIRAGLLAQGFSASDTAKIMGGNWYRFYADALRAARCRLSQRACCRAGPQESDMSTRSETAGFMAMKGAGYYSKATTGARDVINAAAPLILAAVDRIPRNDAAAPFAARTSDAPTAAPPSRCGGACSPTSAPASRPTDRDRATPTCRATISASSSA